MGLIGLIVVIALGIALYRGVAGRLDNTRAKPKRVFFWAWTPEEEIERVMRQKADEQARKRYGFNPNRD